MKCQHCKEETIVTRHNLEQNERLRLCLGCGLTERTIELWVSEHKRLTFREMLWAVMCKSEKI